MRSWRAYESKKNKRIFGLKLQLNVKTVQTLKVVTKLILEEVRLMVRGQSKMRLMIQTLVVTQVLVATQALLTMTNHRVLKRIKRASQTLVYLATGKLPS